MKTDKYQLTGRLLAEASIGATLVDVGARDRILRTYLPGNVQYLSADISGQHDFCWNLERPIPCEDGRFDHVVALDVLEHVDNLHLALEELLRIARTSLLLTLPNMACLSYRLSFLRHGVLAATDKYSLLRTEEDRHRWLPVYREIGPYLQRVADRHRCNLRQYNLLCGTNTFVDRLATYLPLSAGLRTHTVFAVLQKNT